MLGEKPRLAYRRKWRKRKIELCEVQAEKMELGLDGAADSRQAHSSRFWLIMITT